MGIMSFFSTTCETRELHQDTQLRTKYFRNNFNQCVEGIQKFAAENHLEVRNINPEHGEVYMIGPGFDVIFTIIQTTLIESGIDLKINLFSFTGMGRPKRKALEIYKYLESVLKFKGVSLHP